MSEVLITHYDGSVSLECRYPSGRMEIYDYFFRYAPTLYDLKKLVKIFQMSEQTDDLIKATLNILKERIADNKLKKENANTKRLKSKCDSQIKRFECLISYLEEVRA